MFFNDENRFIGEIAVDRMVRGELSESCNGRWKVFSVEYEQDEYTLRKKEYLRMEDK